MITEVQIFDLIKDRLEEDGVFLVSLIVAPGNKIMVSIDSMSGISIEYCIEINKLIEHSLDREIEDFELEVGSAGIGQPFKVRQQYIKHIGKSIEVIDKGGLKIKGTLSQVIDDHFMVDEEKMVKPEGKKKKELQIIQHSYKFEEVKSVKEIITF
jgi:ribosome maturation factor RimP